MASELRVVVAVAVVLAAVLWLLRVEIVALVELTLSSSDSTVG